MMAEYYLKPNVVIEPLVCKWYAWLHLVSPMTAGLHFKKRYIKLLDSYIEHRQLHQQAAQNPELAGGFFVNIDDKQFEQARTLLHEMQQGLQSYMKVADAVTKANEILMQFDHGNSLEGLYEQLPDELKGAIELLYDVNNNPSARYLEPVLYQRFYDPKQQSLLLSSYADLKQRPFVTSTPRLKKEEDVELQLPFASEHIDQLVESRQKGLDLEAFAQQLDLSESDFVNLKAMFHQEKPVLPKDRDFIGEGVRVRYFGHACVLLQTKNTSILIDPLIRNYEYQDDSFSYFDLPDQIDAVLITHAHQDHLVLETLLQLRGKINQILVPRSAGGFLPDPSMKLMLKQVGFKSVNELDEFETIQIGDFTVKGIPFLGEHGDLNIRSKLAYYVAANEDTFLFAVDSNNIDPRLYQSIREMLGTIDTVFIGMECKGAPYSWTYGPLSFQPIPYKQDQSRRLSGSDSEKAWKIITLLGAKKCYIYAMGLEPWLSYLLGLAEDSQSFPMIESNQFIKRCEENAIPASRLYLQYER